MDDDAREDATSPGIGMKDSDGNSLIFQEEEEEDEEEGLEEEDDDEEEEEMGRMLKEMLKAKQTEGEEIFDAMWQVLEDVFQEEGGEAFSLMTYGKTLSLSPP